MNLMVLLGACLVPTTIEPEPPPPTPPPATCDAGDAAWVQRAIPLMWGRRPLGSAEVAAWSAIVAERGRSVALRGMAQSPEYAAWWSEWLTDVLAVARTGDKEFGACFAQPLLTTHDGSLAQHLRTAERPWLDAYDGGVFNMADVLRDAVVADDLIVPFQAYLLTRMARPVEGANVSAAELEYNRRVNFGEGFYEVWLNRNLDCVPCHNSGFSTTDDVDARFDLTWQLPGQHEVALLGAPGGFDKDALFAPFRHADLVDAQPGRQPWGISADCGVLRGPNGVPGDDFLGQQESFFIEDLGPSGSVWQLERMLSTGADALATGGLSVGDRGEVDGRESFAYLVGARIVDRVYEAATGGRLTISHGFPRNLSQAERLERATDTFVERGFSLLALLDEVTADPLFNPDLPDACGAVAYGLDPVVNPWSVEEDDRAMQNNSPGDLVHRLPARVLLRSVHAHLERPVPAGWALDADEAEFQAALGVFLRESQPGFNGTDFQGLLTFHSRFATCGNANMNDWLADLHTRSAGSTARELVLAVKDRLLTDPSIDADEEARLEALLGSLDEPAEQVRPRDLRLLCGAILTSAPYMLTQVPRALTTPPTLAPSVADACAPAQAWMEAAGFPVETCGPP